MAEIKLAEDARLLSKEYVHAVGKAFKAAGKSRLEMAEWLTLIIAVWIDNGGRALDHRGREISIDENVVERAFDKQGWFSWATDVKRFADRLPKRNPKVGLLDRLRVVDLAYRINGTPLI